MQRDVVVDIDFDYCVRPTLARGYGDRSRQPDSMRVWLPPDALVEWLGQNLLFQPASFAGIVESHEQVLSIWRTSVVSGKLRVPFDLIHIDAHPDMMDIDAEVASLLETAAASDEVLQRAKPGDFLQYAVRLGWVHHVWMVFPDDEGDRIARLAAAGIDGAAAIVSKPVEAIRKGATGGADLRVRIGSRLLDVSLHTRSTLPRIGPPTVTVLAHSPEFVHPLADAEFLRLARQLRGVPC